MWAYKVGLDRRGGGGGGGGHIAGLIYDITQILNCMFATNICGWFLGFGLASFNLVTTPLQPP